MRRYESVNIVTDADRDLLMTVSSACQAEYSSSASYTDTFEVVLAGNGGQKTGFRWTPGKGSYVKKMTHTHQFFLDRRHAINLKVTDGRVSIRNHETNEEWFFFAHSNIKKDKGKCLMITTGSGISATTTLNPIDPQCSCRNVINAGELTMSANNLVGSSTVEYDEQWTLTAEIKLTDLTIDESNTHMQSIIELTTDDMGEYDFFIPEGFGWDCFGNDLPGNPYSENSIEECITRCKATSGCDSVTHTNTYGCFLKNGACTNIELVDASKLSQMPDLKSAYSISAYDAAMGNRRRRDHALTLDNKRCKASMPSIHQTRFLKLADRGPVSFLTCYGGNLQYFNEQLDPGMTENEWQHWEIGHRYDSNKGEYAWYWAVDGTILYEAENKRNVLFHGEADIATVSTSHCTEGYQCSGEFSLDSMFDGNVSTAFVSQKSTDTWVEINFLDVETVEEIVMGTRQDEFCLTQPVVCSTRYNNVCFILMREDGSKIAEKCTTTDVGGPYYVDDDKAIIVTFYGGLENVKTIRITFPDERAGIGELNIYGPQSDHLHWLGHTPRVWSGRHNNRHAEGAIRNVNFHSCRNTQNLYQQCIDHWNEWGECSVTCGGGIRSRTGWFGGVQQTEQHESKCNTNICPFDPTSFPACPVCSNGSWLCSDNSCPNKHFCQRVSIDDDTAYYCLPQSYGRCYAWGDPHVVTFDGTMNDVYGIANYTFSQVNQNAIGDKIDFDWKIIMETRAWGRVAVATSFKLIVTGPDYGYVINTDENGNYDYTFNFPTYHEVNSYAKFEQYISFSKRGRMVSFLTPFGLRFTNNGFLGDLRLPFAFAYGIEGLCADYGLDKTDDYKCPDGTIYPYNSGSGYKRTTSEWETAKCWKVSGDDGPDPGIIAELHATCPHRTLCDALFNDKWMANCAVEIDTSQFIQNCYTDYCEEPTDSTLEDIYGAFFASCKEKLPNDDAVCTWKARLGYVTCQGSEEWSGCRRQCDALASCDPQTNCDNSILVEGCFCPDGKVENYGMCVATASCPALVCSQVIQDAEIQAGSNILLGTVDLPNQYVFHFEVQLTEQFSQDAEKHKSILKVARNDVARASRCGHREPGWFIYHSQNTAAGEIYEDTKLAYFFCADGMAFNDNMNSDDTIKQQYRIREAALPTDWQQKFAVGQWSRVKMGRLRNKITGMLENFWEWDDKTVVAIENHNPISFAGMEVYAGMAPSDIGSQYHMPAAAKLRKVNFASGESYHDVQGCFDPIWGDWSACSTTCGSGLKTRTGRIRNHPETQDVACNTESCPFDPVVDPNACLCPDGRWWCQSSCQVGKTCQRIDLQDDAMRCLDANLGKCGAYGDPHVFTFDGAQNDVYGVANYTLTQFNQSNAVPMDIDWSVCMETEPIRTVSKAKALTLTVTSAEYSYEIKTDKSGRETLISYSYSFSDGSITTDEAFEAYIDFSKLGSVVSYTTPFGVKILQKLNRAEVYLAHAYTGALEGLCGNYNFDKTDDFTCSDGTVWPYESGPGFKRTTSEYEAAKCWLKTGDEGPDPGDFPGGGGDECLDAQICYTMFDNPIFDNCTQEIDPWPFIDSCKTDFCMVPTNETLEEIYDAFMDACNDIIPNDPGVCTWRNEIPFMNYCLDDTVWSGCKRQCDSRCPNDSNCNNNVIEEGCFCSEGKVFNEDNECILLDKCSDTSCGNYEDWNYGAEWSEVIKDCIDDTCYLTCNNGQPLNGARNLITLYPYPVDKIVCNAKVLIPPQGFSISCEPSPCGSLDNYNFDISVMSASCDTDGCNLTCYDPSKRPNVKFLGCNDITREFDLEAFNLECVDDTDTPCGNFVDSNINVAAGVTKICESLNSIYDPTECHFSCPAIEFLIGPPSITCDSNVLSETDVDIKCCAHECCDITDSQQWATISAVVEIDVAESSENMKVMKCFQEGQIVVDKTTKLSVDAIAHCDTILHKWDLSLLDNIECRNLACDFIVDDVNSVALINGAKLDCSEGECIVSCSDADFSVPEVEKIDCTNAASFIAKGQISCYETSCGNTNTFNFGPNWSDVNVNCNVHGDCELSCQAGFVYPVSQIRCLDGLLIPSPEDGLNISCTDTICGDLTHDASLTSVCTEFGCTLSCNDNTKVPNMKEVPCTKTGEKFNIENQLDCIDNIDTPCGDVPLTLHDSVVKICDEWTSIFDTSCHSCRFTCENDNQRIHGVDKLICENGSFNVNTGHVFCLTEEDETMCGDLDTWITIDPKVDLSCAITECSATCKSGQPSASTIECDINTGIYNVQQGFHLFCEDPQECGPLETLLTLPDDASYSCKYIDLDTNQNSICSVQCEIGLPSPFSQVECDANSQQWSVDANVIECADTKCGSSSSWDFGVNYDQIEKYCHHDHTTDITTCQLQCQSNLTNKRAIVIDQNGNKVESITCDNNQQLLPANGSLALSCAETECGPIEESATVDAVILTLCSDSQCSFKCPDGQMASYSHMTCENGSYNVDGITIECVDEVDTPCGDIKDTFTLNEVSVTCESFYSVHQTEQVICQITCNNPAHFIDGNSELICVNGQFVNNHTNLSCEPTTCGDPADFVSIENDVNVICNNDTCTFECSDHAEVSLIRELICDVETKKFREIILWPDLSPFNVTHVQCDRPMETFCDDPYLYFTNVDTSAYFECNWNTGICLIQCFDNSKMPSIEQVTCNAGTKTFHHENDILIECTQQETECGNLVDNFILDSNLQWVCDNEDECTFSCPVGHTSSVASIKCENEKFAIDGQIVTNVTITCELEPETECGKLIDSFTIDPSVVINCSYHLGRCDFSCSNETQHIEIETVFCDQVNGYSPAGGEIKCSVDYDTGCGNLPNHLLIESNKTCENNVCIFSCDENQHVFGIVQAECLDDDLWSYSYYLPSSVESVSYSRCQETMCGNIDDIKIDVNSVDITTQLDIDGFGSLQLECKDPNLVLTGENTINCPSNTGVWEVDIDVEIECATTVCGDPDSVFVLDPTSEWSCVNNVCTFSCNQGDVNLETLICNEATGEWITGPTMEIKCEMGCPVFGTIESGITTEDNVLVRCKDNVRTSTTQCDLFCHKGVPTVNETDVVVEQVVCTKDQNDGKWMNVEHNQFGVPQKELLENGHIYCDTNPEDSEEDDKTCPLIKESYSISKEIIVKCSLDTCVFECPEGSFDIFL